MLQKKEQRYLDLLGNRIFELRKAKGMTQEEMAEKLETLHNQISRLENGKVNPKITTLLKVAELLDVSVSELTNFIEIKKRPGNL